MSHDDERAWTEEPVTDYGVDVPAWIDPEIHVSTLAAIVQGGCDSGAYMPAVTYHEALTTMNEHGDAIWQYLEDAFGGEVPTLSGSPTSWAGLACFYVSAAVELWASGALDECLAAMDDAAEEADA